MAVQLARQPGRLPPARQDAKRFAEILATARADAEDGHAGGPRCAAIRVPPAGAGGGTEPGAFAAEAGVASGSIAETPRARLIATRIGVAGFEVAPVLLWCATTDVMDAAGLPVRSRFLATQVGAAVAGAGAPLPDMPTGKVLGGCSRSLNRVSRLPSAVPARMRCTSHRGDRRVSAAAIARWRSPVMGHHQCYERGGAEQTGVPGRAASLPTEFGATATAQQRAAAVEAVGAGLTGLPAATRAAR